MKICAFVILSLIFLAWLPYAAALPSAINTHCMRSSDCNEPFESCERHTCTHKSVLPFGAQECIGVVVLALLLVLSSAGGTGGGVIIVPILMSLFQFETKSAIALSNFLVFCSGVTRYVTNYRARHP